MKNIFLGIFLILGNTLYSQDFSFRTRYLTEALSFDVKTTSVANVKVTYEKKVLKIYDITLDKYVIDERIELTERSEKIWTGITDAFLIAVNLKKRDITLLNIKDVQESYTFSLHKQ